MAVSIMQFSGLMSLWKPVVVDARDAGEELAEEVSRLVLTHVPAAVVQVVEDVEPLTSSQTRTGTPSPSALR